MPNVLAVLAVAAAILWIAITLDRITTRNCLLAITVLIINLLMVAYQMNARLTELEAAAKPQPVPTSPMKWVM